MGKEERPLTHSAKPLSAPSPLLLSKSGSSLFIKRRGMAVENIRTLLK